MLTIIPRSTWGARAWATQPYQVPMTERRSFVVHYDGGSPVTRTGYDIPRTIDAEHHANGWSGIGYNFVVSEAADIYEGRGWGLVGAHCPGLNRTGIGVQVAIGGDQAPTTAALARVCDLYDEACRLAGRRLAITWHGANYPTACPGTVLTPWAKEGMPRPQSPTPAPPGPTPGGPMDEQSIATEVWHRPYKPYGPVETANYPGGILAEDRLYLAARAAEVATLIDKLGGVDAAAALIKQLSADVAALRAALPHS